MQRTTIVSAGCVLICIVTIMAVQDRKITRVTDSVNTLVNRIDRLIQEMRMSDPGQMYHEHWSGSPPQKYSVTTTFQETGHENETRSDWNSRHEAAVLALKIAHPPV